MFSRMMGTRSLRRGYTRLARDRNAREFRKTLRGAEPAAAIHRRALVKRSGEILSELRADAVADGRAELAELQEIRASAFGAVAIMSAFATLLAIGPTSGATTWWILAASVFQLVVGLYSLGWSARGRGLSSHFTAGFRERVDARVPKRSAKKVVRAAVIRAANEALAARAPAGSSCAFPRNGARIVEMDPRELIELRSHRDVTQFVEDSDCCTVGLHGARGMGKTGLMLRLQRRHFGRGVSLRITSPSLREPEELPRVVLLALAKRLEHTKEPLPGKWALVVGAAATVMFILSGLALSFLAEQPGVPFGRWAGSLLAQDPDAWTVVLALAAALILFALGAFGVAGVSSVATARGRSGPVAREIIERHTHEVEASSTSGIALAALLGVSMTGGRTKRALPATHADVVHDFERLVSAYRGSSRKRTVLVLIDELDRLPSETVEVLLNEIKDFFHLDGVRVVVSISNEVLTSFQARRTMPTNVFDSSFDTVFEMQAMVARDSLAMINDRVVAMPSHVTYFCHAISGGRPRELLRACRTFVQETWSSTEVVDQRQDLLGIGLVERSRIGAAAAATVNSVAMDECRRLQRSTPPGSYDRRLADSWARAVVRGQLPASTRRSRAAQPRSTRLFVALGLIRQHLEPAMADAKPAFESEPLLPAVNALAALMAAVHADEHVWRSALREVESLPAAS
jgi:hypothetical protein